jgi:transposase
MTTINKQSLRNELDRIKSEFKQMSAENKISPEVSTLINGLMVLLNLLCAIFLEKTTKKNYRNSSIPSSQTKKDETSTSKSKTNSKGKDEKAIDAANTRTVESTQVLTVEQCNYCGESLKDIDCKSHERRTRIDIVFEKTVEHVNAEIKKCPSCDNTIKAAFPVDLKGSLQYGNGIKAYVIQLLTTQMISLNRAQKMVKTLIGEVISQATMLSYIMRLFVALEQWENAAKSKLLTFPCINSDETSLRVDKKNYWIHVYSAEDITLKLLHRKRGKEAMEDLNIVPKYGGVLVHDCWSSYLSYDHCLHGLCGSHILRELTYLIDSNDYSWAKSMKRLLKEYCLKISSRKNKSLNKGEYANLQKRYRNILTRGKKELPSVSRSKERKRGRIAKSDAHNLWERLKKYEKEVLLFSKLPYVPFTNNRAERDLRMSKVKQKVSGCFRKERYARAY